MALHPVCRQTSRHHGYCRSKAHQSLVVLLTRPKRTLQGTIYGTIQVSIGAVHATLISAGDCSLLAVAA